MTSVVITQIMNGITIGLIFALIAIGLTIVMGLMGVVNFAHGSFYMIGGYITFFISSTMGHFWVRSLDWWTDLCWSRSRPVLCDYPTFEAKASFGAVGGPGRSCHDSEATHHEHLGCGAQTFTYPLG